MSQEITQSNVQTTNGVYSNTQNNGGFGSYTRHPENRYMDSWLERYVGNRDRNYECNSIACPTEKPEHAAEYITDKIVHEFFSEDRGIHPGELYDHVTQNYRPEIEYIALLNEHKRKRPTGHAGSSLSALILDIADELGLWLSPKTRAKHEGRSVHIPECHRERELGDVCPRC
jgi:hypothetical protein